MNLRKNKLWKVVLFTGVVALGVLPIREVRAEMEDVEVVGRKPDPSNPSYEIIEVEGGLIFRAPKDMTFVKQYGVIAPVSTEEYCLKKFEGVGKRIDELSQRVAVLEAKAEKASEMEKLKTKTAVN